MTENWMNSKQYSTDEFRQTAAAPVGYVVKRYPRFSETFIVNEILAHEAAGQEIRIFSLKPSTDTHFQNVISQVRAPVCYLVNESMRLNTFWEFCHQAADEFPNLWDVLAGSPFVEAGDLVQAIDMARKVREHNLVHLHAHFATSAATVAQVAAAIAGVPFSITMHAKDIFHQQVDPNDLQRKIDAAKFVVTVSDFNRQYLSSRFGCEQKIFRIYNGLDLDLFSYRRPRTSSGKIIAIGRMVPKKGFPHLIDACRILVDRGVNFECDIVGQGELETKLWRQISDLSLQHCVRLPGPQPQYRIRELIADADVMAVPCVVGEDGDRDGLPTVITESMAIGTPCVATDVTGIPEIVHHGETGSIVPQASPADLADELQQLLGDLPRRQAYASAGRCLVEREFDAHQNVARLRELFSTSIAKPTQQYQQV